MLKAAQDYKLNKQVPVWNALSEGVFGLDLMVFLQDGLLDFLIGRSPFGKRGDAMPSLFQRLHQKAPQVIIILGQKYPHHMLLMWRAATEVKFQEK